MKINEIEVIEDIKGRRLAEVIRSEQKVDKTTFFSDPSSSFQFGFVAHKMGYEEEMHYHKEIEKKIWPTGRPGRPKVGKDMTFNTTSNKIYGFIYKTY